MQETYLPTFWKVEVGTLEMWCELDSDCEAIIATAKPFIIIIINI